MKPVQRQHRGMEGVNRSLGRGGGFHEEDGVTLYLSCPTVSSRDQEEKGPSLHKQPYLDHGKPRWPPPLSLPTAAATGGLTWRAGEGTRVWRRGPQHIPERNRVGWGLLASHHWGECCQARGSGQRLHSVEKGQGSVSCGTYSYGHNTLGPCPLYPQGPPCSKAALSGCSLDSKPPFPYG